MTEHPLKLYDVTSASVLQAMEKVDRRLFVDSSLRNLAYEDSPLSIGYGQTISQPYIVAYMTEAAHLNKEDRVLEIGTGSGYQAAILGELVKEVYTIENVPELADSAANRLKELGYKNIYLKKGNGYEGWVEFAPFDAILVTAAPLKVPEKLLEQLAMGGRMVVPIGSFFQDLYLYTKIQKGVDRIKLLPVRFVPMVAQQKVA